MARIIRIITGNNEAKTEIKYEKVFILIGKDINTVLFNLLFSSIEENKTKFPRISVENTCGDDIIINEYRNNQINGRSIKITSTKASTTSVSREFIKEHSLTQDDIIISDSISILLSNINSAIVTLAEKMGFEKDESKEEIIDRLFGDEEEDPYM